MRILAFGDSITAAEGSSFGGWADRLKHELQSANLKKSSGQHSEHQLLNLGVGGDTSRGLLERIEPEIQTRVKDDLAIIIAIGVNDSRAVDTKDTYAVPPEEYKNNVSKIIQIAKKYSSKILIIGLTPVTKEELDFKNYWYYNSRIKQYDEALKATAEEENLPFVELFEPMQRDNVADYFIDDGLHPNDNGYKFMLEKIRPQVLELVNIR